MLECEKTHDAQGGQSWAPTVNGRGTLGAEATEA
jgi:hypothetical protein